MTDEEYGRAWAKMTGREPVPYSSACREHLWYRDVWAKPHEDPKATLPTVLWELMTPERHPVIFPTEAAAYAALGRAVREVHRLVPRVEGET